MDDILFSTGRYAVHSTLPDGSDWVGRFAFDWMVKGTGKIRKRLGCTNVYVSEAPFVVRMAGGSEIEFVGNGKMKGIASVSDG